MKQDLIVIFTFKYPFEPPTEQFLDDELHFLAEEDGDILLVPSAREQIAPTYPFPGTKPNISVRGIKRSGLLRETCSGLLSLAGNAGYLLRDIGRLLKEPRVPNKAYALKETLKEYVQAGALFRAFVKQIPDDVLRDRPRIVLYSYWLNPAASATALFKKRLSRKKPGLPVAAYARAHGDGDLYRTGMSGYRPCLSLLNDRLDAVFPVSRNGRDALVRDGIPRAETHRLGVKKTAPFLASANAVPLIVSCSVMNGNKRVEKIAELLRRIPREIRWVHFGGGETEQSVRVFCENNLPGNVHWELRGWTPHDAVLDFFRTEKPDLFLNVSRMEGIPVSVMEAMSCSIPCAATDVGASGEIVADNRNGFLLPVDFDLDETARRIGAYLFGDAAEKERMRREAYATFGQDYDAAVNYSAFARRLVSGGRPA